MYDCSNPLLQKIRACILSHDQKIIDFSDYMSLCLYDPLHGYYTSGCHFDRRGDFTTAPELSSLFSSCLAIQCEEVFQHTPSANCILEIGAGSGKMAVDILLNLSNKQCLPKHYLIYEVSPALRQQQQQTLQKIQHLKTDITWLKSLNEASNISGIIIANEVLDAMPVSRFIKKSSGFYRHGIGWSDQDGLIERDIPVDPLHHKQLSNLEKGKGWPDGYVIEINTHIRPWLLDLKRLLNQGMILLFDYGYERDAYYHPDREEGTLLCYHQHHVHSNPLWRPGQQDITVHVDFTAVAEEAVQTGFSLAGYTHQAGFLMNCGLLELLSTHHNSPPDHFNRLQQAKQLILPQEMGELIKVMGLTTLSENIEWLGFKAFDQSRQL